MFIHSSTNIHEIWVECIGPSVVPNAVLRLPIAHFRYEAVRLLSLDVEKNQKLAVWGPHFQKGGYHKNGI